jgi:hypothetical protein
MQPTEGCGQQVFHMSDVEIANKIFVHGCLTLLKDQVVAKFYFTLKPYSGTDGEGPVYSGLTFPAEAKLRLAVRPQEEEED